MHVVHTIGTLGDQHGGPSRSVTALCSALADGGAEVDLITLQDRDPDSAPILPVSPRVRVRVLPGHQGSLRGARRLASEVDNAVRRGRSLVHEHGMWLPTNHAVAQAAAHSEVPRVVSPRGMLSSWALGFRRWKKKLAWELYQRRDFSRANLIHVTSQDEAREIRSVGALQPIAVIPNGVDLPPMTPRPTRARTERRALFLSRIHPKKGVLELVEAWAKVRPRDWRLVIAGPDDDGHRKSVEEAIGRLDLQEQTEFTGPIPDAAKWSLYADADLFVLPTFSENFGIVIAEALGSGLPVITTKGAPWSGIETRRCGWWIEIGVEPLETALREATSLSDGELRAMGKRGREYVSSEFSWARVSADLVCVYDWILSGGTPPSSIQGV